MIFSWLRARRRRKLLAEPFPIRWERFLTENVAHVALISPAEQARLRDITRVLVAERPWQGGGGLFVTEEMKVTIAAQAALLLLGGPGDYFAAVEAVVVYPSEFKTPVREDGWEDDGLSDGELDGQAHYRGPVILSWDVVREEGRNPACGTNVVVHEFAHQLDYRDGITAGAPPLGDRALETRWKYVMTVALEDHRRAVDKGEETFFTEHAAENPAEFFADAAEAFYCDPHGLRAENAEIYGLLAAYFKVEPCGWFAED